MCDHDITPYMLCHHTQSETCFMTSPTVDMFCQCLRTPAWAYIDSCVPSQCPNLPKQTFNLCYFGIEVVEKSQLQQSLRKSQGLQGKADCRLLDAKIQHVPPRIPLGRQSFDLYTNWAKWNVKNLQNFDRVSYIHWANSSNFLKVISSTWKQRNCPPALNQARFGVSASLKELDETVVQPWHWICLQKLPWKISRNKHMKFTWSKDMKLSTLGTHPSRM